MKTTAIFTRTLTTSTTLNECSKGLEFVSNGDGTCSVSGIGTCTDTDIEIPPVHNGEIVTGIGKFAFYDCRSLTSISIPDSVTSIGIGAFFKCTGLTSISIPDNVTSLGKFALKGCTGIKNIAIGNGMSLAL